jgi:hypothetical protein
MVRGKGCIYTAWSPGQYTQACENACKVDAKRVTQKKGPMGKWFYVANFGLIYMMVFRQIR